MPTTIPKFARNGHHDDQWHAHVTVLDVGSAIGAEPAVVKKNTVVRVPGIEKLSKANLSALNAAAKAIGVPVDWLATVMSFETAGTFSPNVPNKAGSGAFGLIQFMPSTAASLLGYPQTEVGKAQAAAKGKAMSFATQLKKMVIPYFKGGKYNSLNDLYLRVFYPAAMNKAPDYVVGKAPSAVYNQNKGFDKDGKGWITQKDITRTINSVFNGAASLPRIVISAPWGQILVGLVVSGGIYYAYREREQLPAIEKQLEDRVRKLLS